MNNEIRAAVEAHLKSGETLRPLAHTLQRHFGKKISPPITMSSNGNSNGSRPPTRSSSLYGHASATGNNNTKTNAARRRNAMNAERARLQQQANLKAGLAEKRKALIKSRNNERERKRQQAQAIRQGNVTKVRAIEAALKKIRAQNFNIKLKLAELNNRANKTQVMNRNNAKRILQTYKNNSFTVAGPNGQLEMISVRASNTPAIYRALMNRYNAKFKAGSKIARGFRSVFSGPSVRAAQAKAGAKGFFTTAPRLGGIGARLKFGTMGKKALLNTPEPTPVHVWNANR
jgi:hypothetical protein